MKIVLNKCMANVLRTSQKCNNEKWKKSTSRNHHFSFWLANARILASFEPARFSFELHTENTRDSFFWFKNFIQTLYQTSNGH